MSARATARKPLTRAEYDELMELALAAMRDSFTEGVRGSSPVYTAEQRAAARAASDAARSSLQARLMDLTDMWPGLS